MSGNYAGSVSVPRNAAGILGAVTHLLSLHCHRELSASVVVTVAATGPLCTYSERGDLLQTE